MKVKRRIFLLDVKINKNGTRLFAKCRSNLILLKNKIVHFRFNEMGEQHNKLLNGRLKETKQDLIHEFRRIEVLL